eukprot:scaffold15512_cov110-Isochrysis_galbana.AAC.1
MAAGAFARLGLRLLCLLLVLPTSTSNTTTSPSSAWATSCATPSRSCSKASYPTPRASPVPPPRAYVEHKAQPPPTAVQT